MRQKLEKGAVLLLFAVLYQINQGICIGTENVKKV